MWENLIDLGDRNNMALSCHHRNVELFQAEEVFSEFKTKLHLNLPALWKTIVKNVSGNYDLPLCCR